MGTIKDKLQKAMTSKEAIKAALIAKGVENVDDVMSHYAGFIEAIQSGSSYDIPPIIEDGLKHAEEIQKTYNGGSYRRDSRLLYFPKVDFKPLNPGYSFMERTPVIYLYPNDYKFSGNCWNMFDHCYALRSIPPLDTSEAVNLNTFASGCSSLHVIESIDFSSLNATPTIASGVTIIKMTIKNLGKSPNVTKYEFNFWKWGNEEEAKKYGIVGARQSLIDTLVTYSFNRKAAGYSVCTILINVNTRNLLTENEISQITAKGFTLT